MSDTPPYRFCHKKPPPLNWYRSAYNYAIARWLKNCRVSHEEVCPCGHFRDHWFQEDTSSYRSVGTQTECTPVQETRLPLPRAPERRHTTARNVTFQGDTPVRPTQFSDPLATLFGRALGEKPTGHTDRDPKSGGTTARKRLQFEPLTSTPSGYERTRPLRIPTVTNRSGCDFDADITDEDILSITDPDSGESFDDTGILPEGTRGGGTTRSVGNSVTGFLTHTREATL